MTLRFRFPDPMSPVVLAVAMTLAACSAEPDGRGTVPANTSGGAAGVAPPSPVEPPPSPAPPSPVPSAASPTPAPTPITAAGKAGAAIGLEGLGNLRIGQPVPPESGWAERGAQIPGGCRTVSSPAYPGVHAIVLGGRVRRITVGARSKVRLVEGIGVGAPQKAVEQWFPGFRAEPHKYEAAPAKYLTAPNAAGGDPALRFEIGQDGRVSVFHVGTMPVLGYVEGCA